MKAAIIRTNAYDMVAFEDGRVDFDLGETEVAELKAVKSFNDWDTGWRWDDATETSRMNFKEYIDYTVELGSEVLEVIEK